MLAAAAFAMKALPETADATFHYDRAQRLFHWAMAGIILAAIGLGIYASYLPAGTSPRRELLDLHKSLGMSAAVLLVLRLAYRLHAGEPPYRQPLGRATHVGARVGHLGLYAFMLFMPVSGYLYSGAGGYSLPWFGLFSWPRFVPLDKGLAQTGYELHRFGAWGIAGLLVLHVAAVVWHRWVKRDEVLSRMWPGSQPPLRDPRV